MIRKTAIILLAFALVACSTARRATTASNYQAASADTHRIDSLLELHTLKFDMLSTQISETNKRLSSWFMGKINTLVVDYDTTGRPTRSTTQTSELRGGSAEQSHSINQSTTSLTVEQMDSIMRKVEERILAKMEAKTTTEVVYPGLHTWQKALIGIGALSLLVALLWIVLKVRKYIMGV